MRYVLEDSNYPQTDIAPLFDELIIPNGLRMKVFVSPDQIRAALKSLGPAGYYDEAIITTAAMIAIHVLEGGYVTKAY